MKSPAFLLACIMFAFVSCQKDVSSASPDTKNTITATIDGKDETFNNILIAKNISVTQGYSLFFAGGNGTAATTDVMSVTLDGLKPITTGTFTLSLDPSGNYFPGMAFTLGGSVIYQQDLTTALPTILTITSLTSTNVQGTFSGKLVLFSGSGASTKTVTNGKFNVDFK